ncbi:TRAP transporter small permease [Acuticoccus sp. M5D2P5]|uniref:TRAP transporter small permease n=1 Tax=Acuticoccus kalidii TaxID=2910977 RepID=UPI001F258087|nr:TRAP transporter small permease [Acuticoccus kalidii]MCF3933439.1 TRAP transporter small permease [Acuticoccus kalidii]
MSAAANAHPWPIRWLITATAALAALSLAIAIGCLATQVVARYGLGAALTWPEELAKLCFVWATFLGAAAGAGQRAHIAVDIFVNKFPERLQVASRAIVSVAIVALLVILTRHGISLVLLGMNSRLPAIDVPLGILFLGGTVSVGLMAIIYASEAVSAVRHLISGTPEEVSDDPLDPAKAIG